MSTFNDWNAFRGCWNGPDGQPSDDNVSPPFYYWVDFDFIDDCNPPDHLRQTE